ncbi:MAG TPA: hypothetical protein VD969_19660 [Symbiobacteriaceae bacterium]|nr:hypothetical protein [Symbiobacteriaceae bacterium]
MITKVTVKAKKDCKCKLCGEPIPAGTEYVKVTVPPWLCWDCDGAEKRFWHFHHHPECDRVWMAVGSECEWIYPDDPADWAEIVEAFHADEAMREAVNSPNQMRLDLAGASERS